MAVDKRVRSELRTQLTLCLNRFDVRTLRRSPFKNVSNDLILATIKNKHTEWKNTSQCLNFKFASVLLHQLRTKRCGDLETQR